METERTFRKIKGINKKALLGLGALLSIVAIIGVSSFFPFLIDPKRWQTVDFLTKEVIIVVIIISGTITSMFIGQAQNADNPKSKLAMANVHFHSLIDLIKPKRAEFRQWVKQVLRPADTEERFDNLCLKNGITDKRLFNLSRQQIKDLVDKFQEYDGVIYKPITKKQMYFILDYMDGRYAIRFVPPDYYLTVSSVAQKKTRSERAGGETKTKAVLLSAKMISHIIRTLLLGMTMASLVYDSATAGSDAEQAMAWITFASRMSSLIMASFSGYVIGYQTNDIEAEYIEDRCSVQEDFLNDKTFKPKSEQELTREEYEEYLKNRKPEKAEVVKKPIHMPESQRMAIAKVPDANVLTIQSSDEPSPTAE